MYLNAHSYCSLRYGTMAPEALAEKARLAGMDALCLTDINNSTAIPDFVKACKNAQIKPLAGMEFRYEDKLQYIAIAKNNNGIAEINKHCSMINFGRIDSQHPPNFSIDVWVIYPFYKNICRQLKENERIGVAINDLTRLRFSPYLQYPDYLVIAQPLTFEKRDEFVIHKNLRAIAHNTLISRLTPDMVAHPNEILLNRQQLLHYYSDFPNIIRNTERIFEQSGIDFDFESSKNKKHFTGTAYDDKLLLEKLAYDGLAYRYGKHNKQALQRLQHELQIIDNLGFSAYFLITWDIIRYSMSRGFYHVGRGSGANSVVAYCLKITNVDPIELDLYFERFINPKRSSPPDFDIDYSWKERAEVQDYIFKRYGAEHTALLGTMSTFRDRATYRELGKVHGLPKKEIDELVKHPEKAAQSNHITQHIHQVAQRIADFPNIRSIHAGGILISEQPIYQYTALDMPPKGFPTTQWDMYVAEELRFEKLDILSQRGIGHIKECADIILQNHGIAIDVHDVKKFKADAKVKQHLEKGETIGCFYIESPAMRGLLKKLHCNNYLTLVAASSIIRPGVARSGMMKEYIFRFHHPDKFEYLHPVMKEQLHETFGVMVYQEDVLKICHHFAGLDLADADVLRRAMSGKFRGKKELARIVDKFFENCHSKGYDEKVIREVWRQIDSFAGYSFSKAHSASYAVESYQSLFLKAYFPLEFMVAVINNFGGFYETWFYFHEAKRYGAVIELPCVNCSSYHTSIDNTRVYIGWVHVANLEYKTAITITEERQRNGKYLHLADFTERTGIALEQLILLIRLNALRFTGKSKANLLWEAHLLCNKTKKPIHQTTLFRLPVKAYQLPQFYTSALENAYDEIELLGFPVSCSMFDMLETPFRGEIQAGELPQNIGKTIRMLGNLVTIKYVFTVKKEMMFLASFIDASGAFFDTVHFPLVAKQFPFKGKGIYLLLGTVTEEFAHCTLQVHKMAKMPIQKDPRGI